MHISFFKSKYFIFAMGLVLGAILSMFVSSLVKEPISPRKTASNSHKKATSDMLLSSGHADLGDPDDTSKLQIKNMNATIGKLKKNLNLQNAFLASLWNGLSIEEKLKSEFDQEGNILIDDQLLHILTELNLPRYAIENVLKHLVNIDPSDIPGNVSIEEFVVRLVEVASAGLITPSPSDPSAETGKISFDSVVDADNASSYPRETFNSDDNRIYASFSTGDYEGDVIIAKWVDLKNENIMLFKQFPIVPEMDNNFVYLEKDNGWQPGEYAIEIYGLNEDIPLISSGKFRVNP